MKVVWEVTDIRAGTTVEDGSHLPGVIVSDIDRAGFVLIRHDLWQVVAVNNAVGLADYLTAKGYRMIDSSN